MTSTADEKAIPLHRNGPNNDENLLASLGYKQEFKRDFSRLELASLCLSIVGVVQSIAYVPYHQNLVCVTQLVERFSCSRFPMLGPSEWYVI